jgi:hypothetical protein
MAQVLSLIVFILSIFNELAWMIMLFLGVPAFILIQTAWCCAMNKCGFIFAGVLALVGACILLLLGIALSDILNNCGSYESSYYNDWDYDFCDDKDEATIWMNLSFSSGILWATTGILVLVFACGKRYQDIEDQLTAEGAGGAVAVRLQAPVMGTSRTTIANRPDGSVEKKTVVTNADGSNTVTVVILEPTLDV